MITGETAQAERQAAVDRFQTDPACRVFVGSIKAAGVGFTLTASSHVIFAELDWVPGNITQAEDRCHRIGQTDSVLVQHVVVDGSLDARMADMLVAKQDVIDRALDKGAAPIAQTTATVEQANKVLAAVAVTAPKTPDMPAEQVAAIQKALRLLANLDPDYACEKNDAGFNSADGDFGHKLAGLATLTPRQAAAARKMLLKYKRQIPNEVYEVLKG